MDCMACLKKSAVMALVGALESASETLPKGWMRVLG